MKVLVQSAMAVELDDESDLPGFVLAIEEGSRRDLTAAIAVALERLGPGCSEQLKDEVEWYGISVMPLRDLEAFGAEPQS